MFAKPYKKSSFLIFVVITCFILGCGDKNSTKSSIDAVSQSTPIATDSSQAKPEGEVASQSVVAKDSGIVNESRVDITTNIEKYKLLGFTLGDTYSGALGQDWSTAEKEWGSILYKSDRELRSDLFKGATLNRLVAPNDLGEIHLLLTPQTKKIINMMVIKKVQNNDYQFLLNFVNNINQDCSKNDLNFLSEMIAKIKGESEFKSITNEFLENSLCDIKAVGYEYNKEYNGKITISKGDSIQFRDGTYNPKVYKPSTLIIKVDDKFLYIGFTHAGITLKSNINAKELAFYNKTGINIEDLMKVELANLAASGDIKSILASAKSSSDPRKILELLLPVEEKNIEAKLMIGDIYLKNSEKSEKDITRLDKSKEESIKEAFTRFKFAADKGSKEGMTALAGMYRFGLGVERNLSTAAKLLLASGGEKSADFFNFCQTNESLPECAPITAQTRARELASMSKFTIVAACSGVAKQYIRTVMLAMRSSFSNGISAINAQSKYCNTMNSQLNDENILFNKEFIGNGPNGSKFYISQSNDNIAVGLIRRSD